MGIQSLTLLLYPGCINLEGGGDWERDSGDGGGGLERERYMGVEGGGGG